MQVEIGLYLGQTAHRGVDPGLYVQKGRWQHLRGCLHRWPGQSSRERPASIPRSGGVCKEIDGFVDSFEIAGTFTPNRHVCLLWENPSVFWRDVPHWHLRVSCAFLLGTGTPGCHHLQSPCCLTPASPLADIPCLFPGDLQDATSCISAGSAVQPWHVSSPLCFLVSKVG